ncbi:MAG TPA: S-layer homology domain-containing protein [Syntrophomonadaceae bacterium]|nr:S-layer homology domain-containing protein [Syntrophomonadaceae bacterium]
MNKRFYKSISFLTLVFFMFSMVFSFALPASAALSSPYSDVNSNHWAFKHVVKMDHRTVVAGYVDKTFKPDNAVTQLEALLMTVRNMEADSELAKIDTNRTLPFKVPEWAEKQSKSQILYALDQGLIIASENDFDATRLASRAWITRLIVRSIGKDAAAILSSDQTSDFADDADIAPWARGYINTAVKCDIIAGFPDGTFKPTQIVTRAQTVVLLGNSEPFLNLTRTSKGKVLNTTDSSINIQVNGQTNNYIIGNEAVLFGRDNSQISLANIKTGQEVLFVAASSNIKYLELLTKSDQIITPDITGTLIKVLADQRVIIIKDNEGFIHTKFLSPGVQCLDTNGRAYNLDQIPLNAQVSVALDAQGFVSSFTLEASSGFISDSGIIYEIDTKNQLIILKSQDTFSTFQYSDLVEIAVEGLRFAVIEDLRAGDEVKLETDNNLVTKITLLKTKQELTISGIVVMNDKNVIVIKQEDGTFETFKLANNYTVDIDGIDIPRIDDVLVDDKVTLEIKDGLTRSIKVTNRSIENKLKGTIVAVDKDADSPTLVLETSDGKLHPYAIAKYADYDIDNIRNATISDINKGMKIEVEILDGKIIYIANKNSIEGTVLSVNPDRNLLSIKTYDQGSVTYRVSENVDVRIEDIPRANLEDIERNDIVEVKIAKEFVTEIYVEKSYVYEVTSSSNDSLRATDGKNKSKYIYNDDKPEIIISGINKPVLRDFKAGDLVRVTYQGFKLIKVELVPATAGEILSVNWASQSFTILGFDGKTTNLSVANRLDIIKDGKTYNNLNAVDIGDRIKVRETADNDTQIHIMSKLRTQYVDTENNNTKLYITRNAGYSYVVYDLANPCYIHKGNQTYTFNNLRENDWVEIYYIDNVVYEIEKQ